MTPGSKLTIDSMNGLRKALTVGLLGLCFSILSCGWMGEEPLSFLEGEQVISRTDALEQLKLGVVVHSQSCPIMEPAALFSLDGEFQDVLSRTHYYKSKVDQCFVLLVASPCPDATNTTISAGFYEAIVRSCNPGPAT
ncbi:MAG: hypothetical protein CMF59_15330 [Leptospiraceae bacterium]|nr:hypothetical protein [Leptospiraceae bacterium]